MIITSRENNIYIKIANKCIFLSTIVFSSTINFPLLSRRCTGTGLLLSKGCCYELGCLDYYE